MTRGLQLTSSERAMLAGEAGAGMRRAMEIIVALGQIYGASDLVPVSSAQVSGVSYKNLGEAGLEFLQSWAEEGARACIPTTLNPAGADLAAWQSLGFSEHFVRKQEAVIAAYTALGAIPTCTCTPYLAGYVPEYGQHVAWAESSAVSYANSVLGARTNREGGPSALAAAITGRTARYGLHMTENRRATTVVEVRCPVTSEADAGALGYLVGRQVGTGVPLFRFRDGGLVASTLRQLGAAMASSGAVALYHVEGVTPEARAENVIAPDAQTVVVDDLRPGYAALDGASPEVDVVSLGCPHASLAELEAIAERLDGRQVRTALWITTSRAIRELAQESGAVPRIEKAGGKVVADTCMVVAPVDELGFRTLATNSGKMALYAPSHGGLSTRFGSMEKCLEAAVSGQWPDSHPAVS
jgi:predicted aconitase